MKNNTEITKRDISRRTLAVFMAIVIAFVGLVGRIAYIQFTDYKGLKDKVLEQYSSVITLPASRGTIYDRNMKTLAMSESVENIYISPKGVENMSEAKDVDYKTIIADGLSEILDVDRTIILARMEKTNSQYETIKKNISEEEAAEVREFVVKYDLSSMITIEESSKRYYQYGSLASHIIGVNGTDGGLNGLEKTYNTELSGTNGRIVKSNNAKDSDLTYKYETYVEAQNGSNLVTTIDVNIQSIVEKYLEKVYNDQKAANRVAAVVMDVNNGEIYASAVYPNYDLNDPYTLTESFLTEYEEYAQGYNDTETGTAVAPTEDELSKKKLELVYQMWNNKVVNDLYEPGSTFKIVTTAMAMEEGIASLADSFDCQGQTQVDGVTIKCHKAGGHGVQTFAETLQNSCNPAFVSLGLRIGKSTFMRYFEEFGYLDLSGCDMVGESKTYYHGTNNSQFGRVELANYSFGQSFKTTIIQQLRAVSTVANGGYLVTPHLAKYLTDDDGNITHTYEYDNGRQVISSSVADSIVEMLYGGINTGSTKNAAVEGYSIAAKTGTSQKLDVKDRTAYVSSCVAFAPAEDPQVAIIVIVDEPTAHDYYGGLVAAPVVSSVLSEVLPYLGIPANGESEHENVTVTKMIGKNTSDAVAALEKLGFNYKIVGNGLTVVDQMPLSGTSMTVGGTVILYTEETEDRNTVTVPSLIGYRAQDALQILKNKGLNVRITGAYSSAITGTPLVVLQDIADTEVEEGTVITIEFRYNNNIYG